MESLTESSTESEDFINAPNMNTSAAPHGQHDFRGFRFHDVQPVLLTVVPTEQRAWAHSPSLLPGQQVTSLVRPAALLGLL